MKYNKKNKILTANPSEYISLKLLKRFVIYNWAGNITYILIFFHCHISWGGNAFGGDLYSEHNAVCMHNAL